MEKVGALIHVGSKENLTDLLYSPQCRRSRPERARSRIQSVQVRQGAQDVGQAVSDRRVREHVPDVQGHASW